jgi:hypothetical protein
MKNRMFNQPKTLANKYKIQDIVIGYLLEKMGQICDIKANSLEDKMALASLLNLINQCVASPKINPGFFLDMSVLQKENKLVASLIDKIRNEILTNPDLFKFFIPNKDIFEAAKASLFADIQDKLTEAYSKHYPSISARV